MPTPLRASPLPGPRPAPPPPQFTPGRRGTLHHRSRSQPVYSEPFVVRLTRPLAVGTCHGGRSCTPRARWGRHPGCGRGGGSGAGGQGQSQGHTAGPSPVQWPSLSHTAGLGSRSLSIVAKRTEHTVGRLKARNPGATGPLTLPCNHPHLAPHSHPPKGAHAPARGRRASPAPVSTASLSWTQPHNMWPFVTGCFHEGFKARARRSER